jgi:hypothetical protein
VACAALASLQLTRTYLGAASDSPRQVQHTDGHSWRKYGCKTINGAQAPRSYFKCVVLGCPAKKQVRQEAVFGHPHSCHATAAPLTAASPPPPLVQVERNDEGAVTFLRYEGEHDHEPGCTKAGPSAGAAEAVHPSRRQAPTPQAGDDGGHGAGADEAEEGGGRKRRRAAVAAVAAVAAAAAGGPWLDGDDDEARDGDVDGDGGDARMGVAAAGGGATRVVPLQTDADVLDDGWRWRKYGQKFVHGSQQPRSYYKCTTPGCPMRKHVERSSSDASWVVSTYEGAHSHPRPATSAPRGGAAIPGRPTSAALRAAASVLGPQTGGDVRPPAPAHRAPSAKKQAALAQAAQAAAAPQQHGAAQHGGGGAPGGAARRNAFKPPPLTIPGGELEGVPSFGPATSLGRMPLSAVLAGADDDMVNASMTLLDSAKGTGLRPFSRGAGPLPSAGLESLGRLGRSGVLAPGAGLLTGGWTPVSTGAALDAVVGFFNMDTPSFRLGPGFGASPPAPAPAGLM